MDSHSQSPSEVEKAEAQTHTRIQSWTALVHSYSLKQVISQLTVQISPCAPESGNCLQANCLLDTQRLLSPSFPWVQVTEEKQEANCLLQPTAHYQVAKCILGSLEEVLGPRAVLEKALLVSSPILQQYVAHLVALNIAQLVPDQLSPNQDRLRVVSAADCLPLPATLTVSSELVEDLLIQLMLKLHPLSGFGVRQLDQQQLLALCLHMSAVTLETLRRVPGIAVDTSLPPPLCNTRRAAVLLQSRLMKSFGSSIQVKKLLAMRDPALLCSIPHVIIEAVLTMYQPGRQADLSGAPNQAPRERDEMETRLFSQLLPESLREKMFQQYGTWIRCTKVFQKALRRITDQDILEYRSRVAKPRSSNRDVVWVDGTFFVGDDYEEVKTPTDSSFVKNPLALDCSLAAFMKQFPETELFAETKPVTDGLDGWSFLSVQGTAGGRGDQGFVCGPEGKPTKSGFRSLQSSPPQPLAGVQSLLTTERAVVQESTIKCILVELFRGRDKTLYRPQHLQNRTFEKELVQHIHSLLQKEAAKYQHNRVFLRNLQRLTDPEQEIKLSLDLSWPLKVALGQALPNVWLSRQGLMEDPQIALLACSLIATEILNHLKPSVSFAEGTKSGEETPFSVNIPVQREEGETERDQTLLELRLQKQRKESREEFWSTEPKVAAVTAELKEKKKKKKWLSWLCGLFRRKRT